MSDRQWLPVLGGVCLAIPLGFAGYDTLAVFTLLIGATVMLWVKP